MKITLTNPKTIYPDATSIMLDSVHFSSASLQVKYSYLADDNSIVKADSLTISGADLTDIFTYLIDASHVGLKCSSLFQQIIMAKIKTMLALTGSTV